MVSDVVMPRMSGRELSQSLVSFRPNMKTVFMSGYIDDVIERHGVHMDGVAFLQKPFSLAVLARANCAICSADHAPRPILRFFKAGRKSNAGCPIFALCWQMWGCRPPP